MHCHFAHHQFEGMNLVMQEGEIHEMAPLPSNFPTCNNFRVNLNQFYSILRNQDRMLASKGGCSKCFFLFLYCILLLSVRNTFNENVILRCALQLVQDWKKDLLMQWTRRKTFVVKKINTCSSYELFLITLSLKYMTGDYLEMWLIIH